MKLRRHFCLLLAVLMILPVLSGCAGNGNSPRVKDGIYASCGNYDFTIYRGLSSVISIRFYLTTQQPLPDGTEIQINTEAEYDYVLQDITPDSITASDYPYGLYCCVRGMDFEKLKKLEIAVAQAQAIAQSDPTRQEAYTKAAAQLSEYQNQYLEDYEAMMEQPPKPEFYHYLVDIRCKDATGDPEITQVELVAGDWSHTVEIGTVKVREAPFPENFSLGVTGHRLAVQGGAGSAWYPYTMVVDAVNFEVDEDVTLTNAYFYGETSAQVVALDLTIASPTGSEVNSQWKPGDTLQLRKGETVTGTVSFSDGNLSSAEYGSSLVFLLEFDRGGESSVLVCSFSLFRKRNPQEIYLWAFQKVDVQKYYEYLYGT